MKVGDDYIKKVDAQAAKLLEDIYRKKIKRGCITYDKPEGNTL